MAGVSTDVEKRSLPVGGFVVKRGSAIKNKPVIDLLRKIYSDNKKDYRTVPANVSFEEEVFTPGEVNMWGLPFLRGLNNSSDSAAHENIDGLIASSSLENMLPMAHGGAVANSYQEGDVIESPDIRRAARDIDIDYQNLENVYQPRREPYRAAGTDPGYLFSERRREGHNKFDDFIPYLIRYNYLREAEERGSPKDQTLARKLKRAYSELGDYESSSNRKFKLMGGSERHGVRFEEKDFPDVESHRKKQEKVYDILEKIDNSPLKYEIERNLRFKKSDDEWYRDIKPGDMSYINPYVNRWHDSYKELPKYEYQEGDVVGGYQFGNEISPPGGGIGDTIGVRRGDMSNENISNEGLMQLLEGMAVDSLDSMDSMGGRIESPNGVDRGSQQQMQWMNEKEQYLKNPLYTEDEPIPRAYQRSFGFNTPARHMDLFRAQQNPVPFGR